ncbi:Hsp20/alpha crystallin family protein [Paraburkholderia terrae]|uniref:Hsp20/alpha crystallin family protein n=1 Tax=Paraburkholderia terrae TaxID=311230 RepID=UPI001EE274BE|nr:Hsp20/alpha crystallin family protein [Paraburkholderia terrae]GJH05903.1 Hsp20/alpha crystallin family protein [Paraburkholderia terrae]
MNDNTELATRQPRAEVSARANEETGKPPTRIAPPVDVFEDSRGITLYADLPGVPRDKLDVRVQDGSLSIEAEAVVPTPSGLRLQHGEVRHPHFWRAFTLSPDFDVSRIDAQLRDGVLKLTIPRREEARPRRIQVNVG